MTHEDLKFQEWVNDIHKTRIDKARNRHPVMTQIRKYADDKIIEMFKTSTNEETKFISVFQSEEFKPSSIDKLLFQYEKYYKQLMIKFKLFKKSSSETYKKFDVYNKIILNKIDNLYHNSLDQKSNQIEKMTTQNVNSQNFFIKKLFQFYNKFISPQYTETELKLLEKEKLQKKIENKMIMNRISNFWRNVLLVKPNYIIEVNKEKVIKTKNKEATLFYKIFKIISTKLNFNINITKRKVLLLPFLLSFAYLVKYKYNLYDIDTIKEFEENDKITELIINEPQKVKKISTIFDEEMDDRYLKILKKEKEFSNISMEKLNFMAENENDNLAKEYLLLLNTISVREALYITLKSFITGGYFIYNYIFSYRKKKIMSLGKIGGNSLILFIALNEIFTMITYADYLQQKNFCAIYDFNNDFSLLHQYNFYRSNIHNAYIKI